MRGFKPTHTTSKLVEAHPIVAVDPGFVTIELADGTEERRETPLDFVARSVPNAGSSHLIEYVDGYMSHCPSDVFLRSAKPILDVSAMSFSDALVALKTGSAVCRRGWNGKGMFLILVPGSQDLTVDEGRPLARAGVPIGTTFNYLPHIDMWTAQGDFVPWLASQTDMLADDWMVVPEKSYAKAA